MEDFNFEKMQQAMSRVVEGVLTKAWLNEFIILANVEKANWLHRRFAQNDELERKDLYIFYIHLLYTRFRA